MKNELKQTDLLTQYEIQEILRISDTFLHYLITDKQFQNAIQVDGEWKIPREDVLNYKEDLKVRISSPCIKVSEVAKKLGYKTSQGVHYLLYTKHLKGAFKYSKNIYLPLKTFLELENSITHEEKTTYSINDVKEILNVTRNTVNHLIKKGVFLNCYKGFFNEWRIPKIDLHNYQISLTLPKEIKSDFLTEEQAAYYLGFTNKTNLKELLVDSYFPNAIKHEGFWKIPKNDLDIYLETISKTDIEVETFSPKSSHISTQIVNIQEYRDNERIKILDMFNVNDTLNFNLNLNNENLFSAEREFTKLVHIVINNLNPASYNTSITFIEFCRIQINNLTGTNNYKLQRAREFNKLYIKLCEVLKDELRNVSASFVSNLISDNSNLTVHQRRIFSKFLNYYYDKNGIIPKERIYFNSVRNYEKQIYTPEEFHAIYRYAINQELHVEKAIKNRNYANMWVYVLLLLTDFIRGQDLIDNTPNINLENLEIPSLEWFEKNTLNEKQGNIIIKQIYNAFRNKRTSKTDELLTFLISPDIVLPLATSLVISELHRQINNSLLILDSFIVGKYQTHVTQGKISHLHFFDDLLLENFSFGSQKMNNSVATYLFYSITELDGQDSDISLYLTQQARSHKNSESTSIYIQSTNKDGTINKVSYNLFKRGHFGWLYNYLILFTTQFENLEQNLFERTNLIENMRQEMAPYEIENLGKFIHNSIKSTNIDNYFENEKMPMEKFIENIYLKRQSIISKLSTYSKEVISKIIENVSKGKLPAKNENCQCFIYPNCQYPNLNNCFSCEYVIPSNLMLIQLNNEFIRIFNEIDNTLNEKMLQKHTKFLLHALFMYKEARFHYGENFVEGFVPVNEIKDKLNEISGKLVMDI